MGLDTNLFSVITNPIDKLVKDASSNIVDTAENAVVGELSSVFQRIGLGSGSNKNILGNLGEQVLAGIAGEIFGAIGREMNIAAKSDIEAYRGVLTDADGRDRDEIMASQVTDVSANKVVKTYTFPPDLNDFYVQMDFKEYRRPAPSVPADVNTVFSIALPLPRTLEDKHDILYNSAIEMGIYGAIFNQAQNGATMNGGFDGTALSYGGREFLKSIIGNENTTIPNLISQAVGGVFNNHVSVMYEQPSLRKHQMSWVFAPNNPSESEKIREITKLLRGASLPAFSREHSGAANINLLSFPMMCKITLMPWGDVAALTRLKDDVDKAYSGNMYTFKHCVIESIKVNYAPSNPAFFADDGNAPAFVGLDIQFLELEYFTADDFGRSGRNIDYGKATIQTFTDLLGKGVTELSEEDFKALEEKNRLRGLDGSAGAVPAQSDATNNFNANSTVVRGVTPDADEPGKMERLYQTADGSWYRYYSDGGDATVTPIDSLNDPIFEKFGVYQPSISDVGTEPLRYSSNNTVLIKTGSNGKLKLGSGTP